jgi:hypothetical protein
MESVTPREYISRNGTKDYDKFFVCVKKHTYIDTCYTNDFKCTKTVKDVTNGN